MVSLSVRLAGVELKNPVIPASGTFAMAGSTQSCMTWTFWAASPGRALPHRAVRATLSPGSRRPLRDAERVGLQNPGIDAVIAEEVPNIAKIFHGPVIATWGASLFRSTLRTAPSSTTWSRCPFWK